MIAGAAAAGRAGATGNGNVPTVAGNVRKVAGGSAAHAAKSPTSVTAATVNVVSMHPQ